MDDTGEPNRQFGNYGATLKWDATGEAQVFRERLFNAFGHGGYKGAGAKLEFRMKGTDKAGIGTKR
jgi:hypothetical protein